jgi:hypothetical protein
MFASLVYFRRHKDAIDFTAKVKALRKELARIRSIKKGTVNLDRRVDLEVALRLLIVKAAEVE